MKYSLLLLTCLPILFCCSKKSSDDGNFINGRVVLAAGCGADVWLVTLDNPDAARYRFLCKPDPALGTLYNCTNSVFMKLPLGLAKDGQKVQFSGVFNYGFSCLSSSFAPQHVEVEKVEAR